MLDVFMQEQPEIPPMQEANWLRSSEVQRVYSYTLQRERVMAPSGERFIHTLLRGRASGLRNPVASSGEPQLTRCIS